MRAGLVGPLVCVMVPCKAKCKKSQIGLFAQIFLDERKGGVGLGKGDKLKCASMNTQIIGKAKSRRWVFLEERCIRHAIAKSLRSFFFLLVGSCLIESARGEG